MYIFACLLISSGAARATHNTVDPFSYYRLVMDPAPDRVEELLGAPCVQQLREYFNAGHDLDIPELRQLATRADQFKYASGRSDLVFYHYTYSKNVKRLAKDHKLDGIFSFLRAANSDQKAEMYIAEDPKSSKHYGRHQTRITLKPEALILEGEKYLEAAKIINKKMNPLDQCTNLTYVGTAFKLILEESGITLYDYYNENRWFYIIDSRGIQEFSFGRSKLL